MVVDSPFSYVRYLKELYSNNRLADEKFYVQPLRDMIVKMSYLFEDEAELEHGLLLGVLGDWGTGKTSILKAFESFFADYMGYPTVFFDAWKYQEDPHPLIPLIKKIREKATGNVKGNFTKAIKTVSRISLPVIDFLLKTATGPLGSGYGIRDIKEAIEVTGDMFIEYSSIYESSHENLRDAVESLIKSYEKKVVRFSDCPTSQRPRDIHDKCVWHEFISDVMEPSNNKHLVILVDDLDRLLPENAMKIFELLRFYLIDVPGTVVIMALNDKILVPAIQERYKFSADKNDTPGGRNFMEKVFHWTYEMPSISAGVYRDYLKETIFEEFDDCDYKDDMWNLFNSLDPLSFRKWVRIKNKILMERKSGRIKSFNDIWVCALKECFPDVEWFLRDFPTFEDALRDPNKEWNAIKEQFGPVETGGDSLFDRFVKSAENDKSVFKMSEKNWKAFREARG